MKCLKMKDGTIKRVPNRVAEIAVENKVAVYCSKKEWKEQTRTSTGKLAKVGV